MKAFIFKIGNTFHKSKWYESKWNFLLLKLQTSFTLYPLLWYSFIPLTDMFHCVVECSIYTQYCSIKKSCILVNFWLQNTIWSHFFNIQVTLDTLFFQVQTLRLSASKFITWKQIRKLYFGANIRLTHILMNIFKDCGKRCYFNYISCPK